MSSKRRVRRYRRDVAAAVWCGVLALALVSCEREERGFRVEPPSSSRVNTIRLTEFQAGTTQPPQVTTNEYEKNAYAVSEGKRLYEQMNCVGCHFHGGGGI